MIRLQEGCIKQHEKYLKDIAHMSEEVETAELMLNANNPEGVFQLLCQESVYIGDMADEAVVERLMTRAQSTVDRHKEMLAELEQRLADAESKVRKAEVEIRTFDRMCDKSEELLRVLGQNKFLVMLDVQQVRCYYCYYCCWCWCCCCENYSFCSCSSCCRYSCNTLLCLSIGLN